MRFARVFPPAPVLNMMLPFAACPVRKFFFKISLRLPCEQARSCHAGVAPARSCLPVVQRTVSVITNPEV